MYLKPVPLWEGSVHYIVCCMSCIDESSNETNNCHGGTVLEDNNRQQAPIPCCDNDTLQYNELVISSIIFHSVTTVTCNAKEESTNNGGINSEMVGTRLTIPLTVYLSQHSKAVVVTPNVQLTESSVASSQSQSYMTTETGYSVEISGDTTNLVCIK